MNGLALCAGVGGLELGLHIADPEYRTVAYVERQAEAAAVLVARMEEEGSLDPAPVWDDLASFDGRAFRGRVDIVTAGYPCQGESNAGRRLGTADPRWLWPQVARIVDEARPDRVFCENVAAHLGRSFTVVLGDLQRMGYRVAAGLFSAFEVGASHERKRLFILADSGGRQLQEPGWPPARRGRPRSAGTNLAYAYGRGRRKAILRQASRVQPHQPGQGMADAEGEHRRPGSRQGDPLRHRHGAAGNGLDLANAEAMFGRAVKRTEQDGDVSRLGQGAGGRGGGLPLPLHAPGPADYLAWLHALQCDPSLEPAICGMADGMANRVDRLRNCGNGVDSLAAAYAYVTLRADLDAAAA